MSLTIPILSLGVSSLLLVIGCSEPKAEEQFIVFDPKVLVGEWRVDSSSDGEDLYDKLVILENGTVYSIDWGNGGAVRKYSKHTFDTIQTEYGDKLFVAVIDSNRISVSKIFGGTNYYSLRPNRETDIAEYLRADSLRTRIVGWWKVRPGGYPFELVNFDRMCDSFTLHIRENGEAIFYAENLLDSSFNYTYRMTPSGISLNNRCVVSDYPIHVINDSTIQLENELHMYMKLNDTLTLDRIRVINQ
jgi:hypothetical protein